MKFHTIEKTDEFDNLIQLRFKYESGFEEWTDFDSNGRKIHSGNSAGYEEWWEYGDSDKPIHYKDSDGKEEWYKED